MKTVAELPTIHSKLMFIKVELLAIQKELGTNEWAPEILIALAESKIKHQLYAEWCQKKLLTEEAPLMVSSAKSPANFDKRNPREFARQVDRELTRESHPLRAALRFESLHGHTEFTGDDF